MTSPDTLKPEPAESLLAHVLKDKRRFWTPSQLAELLDVSHTQIFALIDAGELHAYQFSRHRKGYRPDRIHSAGDLFGGQQRRSGTRITRSSVIKYLMESARFDLSAEDITLAVAKIAEDLPTSALMALEKHFLDVRTRRDR